MIELRWLLKKVCVPHERDDSEYWTTTRVLQYRQMIDKTAYAGLGPMPVRKLEWSDWQTVPEVLSER